MIPKSFKQKLSSAFSSRTVQRATLTGSAVLATIGGASAAGEVINTTAITGIFTDLGTIFPAMGNLVVAILPTILTLAVIGFATGFFDKILGFFDKVFH